MFSYQPLLRVTPAAGPPIVYDLGAIVHMTTAQVIPEPIFLQKEMLNYRLRNVPKGWRLRMPFAWTVEPGSASETTLVEIGQRINRRDVEKVELSMDNGALYREVTLAGWSRGRPEDKNILAIYEVEFAAADLVHEDSLPPETLTAPPAIAGWS